MKNISKYDEFAAKVEAIKAVAQSLRYDYDRAKENQATYTERAKCDEESAYYDLIAIREKTKAEVTAKLMDELKKQVAKLDLEFDAFCDTEESW